MMNIAVCIKPVPDVSVLTLDAATGTMNKDDLVYIANPYDMVALEAAVCLKEQAGEGRVEAIAMAPPDIARPLLRRCLAAGADAATLLWDGSFEGSDGYATGAVLAGYIAAGSFDLVLCGQKAIDTEAGQVGAVIAARLDVPLVSRIARIDVAGARAEVESKLEKGNRARLDVPLPAVLAVELDLAEPRYASLPALLAGITGEIKEMNREALGLPFGEAGAEGSRNKTGAMALPKPRPKKVFTPDASLSAQERMRLIISGGVTQKQSDVLEGDPAQVARTVVQFLKEKNFLASE